MWAGRIVVIVAIAGTLAGCGGSGSEQPGADILASMVNSNDFDTDYSHTTCGEWLHRLTPGQRTAAAYGGLEALRGRDGLSAPSDAEVDRFATGITGHCTASPSDSLVHAVVAVYKR